MNRMQKMLKNEDGKWGYVIAWAVGIPVPILLGVFLLRGCN